MNKIILGIYDEHKLLQEGLIMLLKDIDDVEIRIKANSRNQLSESLRIFQPHILIINMYELDTPNLNFITQISVNYPKIKMLVVSIRNEEGAVLKTIKAGAKGFLSKDTDRNELIEAIYTLRNGFDYFSKSITNLLLNNYIHKLKAEDNSSDIRNLSSREIEILKLWGSSLTNKEIADKLFISVRTVETHKNHIMQKLNLKTSVDMVKFAIKNNIIDI